MSTSQATAAAAVQLRSVAVSAIVPIEGWNPRMAFDDAELRALSASMAERGCLVPVLLQATADGTYRLVDGEKRYKAAVLAALMELPAIVRPADASQDATVEGELLVDAVLANQLRSQLSPVEEALACRRLKTGEVSDGDPWTWRDVAKDPLEVVAGGLHEEIVTAPAGVFVSSHYYALSAFSLDQKRQAAAAELAELRDITVDELELCWDHAAIEQARNLNAAYTPQHGWVTLIVGQDVADTIAGDQVLAALKTARADTNHAQDAASPATTTPQTRPARALTTSSTSRPAESGRAPNGSPWRPGVSVPRCSMSSWGWRSSTRCRASRSMTAS